MMWLDRGGGVVIWNRNKTFQNSTITISLFFRQGWPVVWRRHASSTIIIITININTQCVMFLFERAIKKVLQRVTFKTSSYLIIWYPAKYHHTRKTYSQPCFSRDLNAIKVYALAETSGSNQGEKYMCTHWKVSYWEFRNLSSDKGTKRIVFMWWPIVHVYYSSGGAGGDTILLS